jgi:ABC-type branched-subunit amino acid transport system permease subunit
MGAIYILWLRELKRYTRSRAQILASLGQPLLYLLALGFGLGFLCIRMGGIYLSLTTLGFSEILRIVAINWRSLTKGPVGVLFPPIFRDKLPFYYIVLGLAVLTMAVVWATPNRRTVRRAWCAAFDSGRIRS